MIPEFKKGEQTASPTFRKKLNRIVSVANGEPPALGQISGSEFSAQKSYLTIRARFDGATDLKAGELVGLDAPPAKFEGNTGRTCDAFDIRLHYRSWGILATDAASGSTPLIIQGGIIPAKIYIEDTSHTEYELAFTASNHSYLRSVMDGGIGRILSAESGTGIKAAWIDIAHDFAPGILCKAISAIPAESLFVMDGTSSDTIDGETVEYVKAALTLTGYSDTLHPASVLRVSPGYAVASGEYFLAREVWPRWVRTSAEATVGGCVGHDESGGGAADPWLPGFRALAVDGTTRALVVPDDGYSVGVLATDVSSGKATAKLVEISAGVGTAKSKTFDVHAFESTA